MRGPLLAAATSRFDVLKYRSVPHDCRQTHGHWPKRRCACEAGARHSDREISATTALSSSLVREDKRTLPRTAGQAAAWGNEVPNPSCLRTGYTALASINDSLGLESRIDAAAQRQAPCKAKVKFAASFRTSVPRNMNVFDVCCVRRKSLPLRPSLIPSTLFQAEASLAKNTHHKRFETASPPCRCTSRRAATYEGL